MNAVDILKYGHLWVLRHVDGLTEPQWQVNGVCGVWSVKDIVAHLASFELVLKELLSSKLEDCPTPTLDFYRTLKGDEFNAQQVGQRFELTPDQTLKEYSSIYSDVAGLIQRIPVDTLRQPGTLPWYGLEYALDDFIVYSFYGHKREHMAQVAVYRDRLKAGEIKV